MKKIKLIILFFIIVTSINAQKKCKFDESKEDPFTKKMEVISKFWIKENGVFCQIGFGYKGKSDIFSLEYSMSGEKNYTPNTSDSIMIVTEKGDIVSIYLSKEALPTPYVTARQVYTKYTIICNLSKEQLKQFSESKMKAIKFPYDNNYYSMEVDEGKAEKLMKNAECVLELNQ